MLGKLPCKKHVGLWSTTGNNNSQKASTESSLAMLQQPQCNRGGRGHHRHPSPSIASITPITINPISRPQIRAVCSVQHGMRARDGVALDDADVWFVWLMCGFFLWFFLRPVHSTICGGNMDLHLVGHAPLGSTRHTFQRPKNYDALHRSALHQRSSLERPRGSQELRRVSQENSRLFSPAYLIKCGSSFGMVQAAHRGP